MQHLTSDRRHCKNRGPRFSSCFGLVSTALIRAASAVFLLCACSGSALATMLVVPDSAPTIEAALDAGVDTVLVRPGTYPETPALKRPVFIQGLVDGSGELPTLGGLAIRVASPGLFDVRRIRVAGRVVTVSDNGASDIMFVECDLAGGVVDSSRFMDTRDFSLLKCRVAGQPELWAKGRVLVDSCEVTGNIVGRGPGYRLVVRGSDIQNGGVFSSSHGSCLVQGNSIRGGYYGVSARGDNTSIVSNIIEDCQSFGVVAGNFQVTIANNTIQSCGGGIWAESSYRLQVLSNRVANSRGDGIVLRDDPEVNGNLVWGSRGDGFRFEGPSLGGVRVIRNTSSFNLGSGFVVGTYAQQDPDEWTGNISSDNDAYGIRWLTAPQATISCNDWFGNTSGDVQGRPASPDDIFADPFFCGPDSGDFRLNSSSPLVDRPGCGQIGAFGLGCGTTATVVQRFMADRVDAGVRVRWQVAEGSSASEIWLERSDAIERGAWLRPVTERLMDGSVTVEIDASALPGHAYWYRLVAVEDGKTSVIAAPIMIDGQGSFGFKLVQVGPNPASGPVQITFSLERSATIEMDVFDVKGRRVASPGRGVWPTGTHLLSWDGLTRDGGVAAAGLYVLRYSYPGGQDRRTIVRVR